MHASPFELLELPDGRWCVAKLSAIAADAVGFDPVGFYDSRDAAERAVLRASPAPLRDPRSIFAEWLRHELRTELPTHPLSPSLRGEG